MPTSLPVETSAATTQMIPAQAPPRKKWTRAECELLDRHGLCHGERYELIEGELVSKMGNKRPHAISVAFMVAALMDIFGKHRVESQASIDVSPEDNPTSEPQPDVFVLSRNVGDISGGNPRPGDLLLVCEVSDTSLIFDRTVKARLYARAAIADYWVLDLNQRQLIVHRSPAGDAYTSITAYSEQESVAPQASPGSMIEVSALLPLETA